MIEIFMKMKMEGFPLFFCVEGARQLAGNPWDAMLFVVCEVDHILVHNLFS